MKLEILSNNGHKEVLSDKISKIRDVINYKKLDSGYKFPSERMLFEKIGVGKSNIGEAIQKLGSFGIVELRTPKFKTLYLYCYNT